VHFKAVEVMRALAILSINFEENLSRAHGKLEEPNDFLQSSTITVLLLLKHIITMQLMRIIIIFLIKDSSRNAIRK
jgi:hypothetical protein